MTNAEIYGNIIQHDVCYEKDKSGEEICSDLKSYLIEEINNKKLFQQNSSLKKDIINSEKSVQIYQRTKKEAAKLGLSLVFFIDKSEIMRNKLYACKATFSLLYYLLSILWKRQFLVKNEERKVKR